MRKKLKEEAGLTVVEMLAATAVLTLLALMLSTGLQMVMSSYRTMIAQSETELLLSNAVNTLAGDLRYAWNVQGNDGAEIRYSDDTQYAPGFTYNSGFYGENAFLEVDDRGQIMAKSPQKNVDGSIKTDGAGNVIYRTYQVLSTGAYGRNDNYRQYAVTNMTIKLNKPAGSDEITFTIYLKVETDDQKNSADTTVTVRCLNPAQVTRP